MCAHECTEGSLTLPCTEGAFDATASIERSNANLKTTTLSNTEDPVFQTRCVLHHSCAKSILHQAAIDFE
eukprot:6458983-Amphidinium_carterae.4